MFNFFLFQKRNRSLLTPVPGAFPRSETGRNGPARFFRKAPINT